VIQAPDALIGQRWPTRNSAPPAEVAATEAPSESDTTSEAFDADDTVAGFLPAAASVAEYLAVTIGVLPVADTCSRPCVGLPGARIVGRAAAACATASVSAFIARLPSQLSPPALGAEAEADDPAERGPVHTSGQAPRSTSAEPPYGVLTMRSQRHEALPVQPLN
jgi:hypothetical protein